MGIEQFGRKKFNSAEKKVENAESSVTEKEELSSQLKQRIAKAATSEHINPSEIIELAEQIQLTSTGMKIADKILGTARKERQELLSDTVTYAHEENDIRDALISASKEGNYYKLIEVAERLKEHNFPKDTEGYDDKGTEELRERFASKFSNIRALVNGQAPAQHLGSDELVFIDEEGTVLSGEYAEAEPYSGGQARVRHLGSDHYVFIDEEHKDLPGEYEEAERYHRGKALVRPLGSDKLVFIDEKHNIIPLKE